MKKINKFLIAPGILSTLMIASAPYAKNYFVKTQDNNLNQVNKENNLLNSIINSFGTPAFAECDLGSGDACIDVEDMCMAEQSTADVNIVGRAATQLNPVSEPYVYSINVEEFTTPDPIMNPSMIDSPVLNNHLTGTPTSKDVSFNYEITSPEVGHEDGNLNNGIINAQMYAYGYYDNYNSVSNSWNENDFYANPKSFFITIQHENQAPTVDSVTPSSYSDIVPDSSTLRDIPISFTINDLEENITNVTIELSSNGFVNILQTHTFNNVTAGTTLNYTFTDLSSGNYSWRIRAVETDAPVFCEGFENEDTDTNLTLISPSYSISLELPVTPTPTSTPSPTVTITDTPIPTTDLTPTTSPTSTISPTVITISPTPTQNTSIVSGHLFNDLNQNGTQESNEPNLAGITVIATDESGNLFTTETDSLGNYSFNLPAGEATIRIDRNDPDLPSSVKLTSGQEITILQIAAGNTYNIPNVSYYIPNLQNTGSNNIKSIIIGSVLFAATIIISLPTILRRLKNKKNLNLKKSK